MLIASIERKLVASKVFYTKDWMSSCRFSQTPSKIIPEGIRACMGYLEMLSLEYAY